MSGEFSIQKMFATAINRYDTKADEKNMEKQTSQVPTEQFYRGLIGTQLSNPRTTNIGATRVD